MQKQNRSRSKHYRSEISRLKKENKALRRKLERLKSASLSPTPEIKVSEKDQPSVLLAKGVRSSALNRSRSYFGYLKERFLTASLYLLWKRFLEYFRRVRLISTVIKVTAAVLTVIGTSAFLIVLAGMFIILIPFALILLASVYLSSVIYQKRYISSLAADLKDRSIFVFFPDRGRAFEEDSCFRQTVKLISNDTKNRNFIIIVSPFFISPKGLCEKKQSRYYSVLRYEAKDVCIIRRSAFFAVRHKILRELYDRVSYIY